MNSRFSKKKAAPSARQIARELRAVGDPTIAEHSARFFKTGPGEYGEGDRFHGIRVPVIRKLAKKYRDAPEQTVLALLKSPFHEERLLAVLLLVEHYERADATGKQRIVDLYLEHREWVNNWDIVDSSAHRILGPALRDSDMALLDQLAASESLWDRRIAIISTLSFIRDDEFGPTLHLAARLVNDPEDLIHKATGWMLREVGKRDTDAMRTFLEAHAAAMPRTMLRYAIEKLPERERKVWLSARSRAGA